MNMIKRGCAALLFVLGSLQVTTAMAAEPDPGHINIYADGKFICRIKIEEGQTNLKEEEKNCSVPWARDASFKLENVRSATTIVLSKNYEYIPGDIIGCNNARGYEFTLKTIKDKLTTEQISIHTVRQLSVGMPVVPGVLLEKKYYNDDGSIEQNAIRCLNISFN